MGSKIIRVSGAPQSERGKKWVSLSEFGIKNTSSIPGSKDLLTYGISLKTRQYTDHSIIEATRNPEGIVANWQIKISSAFITNDVKGAILEFRKKDSDGWQTFPEVEIKLTEKHKRTVMLDTITSEIEQIVARQRKADKQKDTPKPKPPIPVKESKPRRPTGTKGNGLKGWKRKIHKS